MEVKERYRLLFTLFIVFIKEEKKRFEYIQEKNASMGISRNKLDDMYETTLTVMGTKIHIANDHLEAVGR